MSVFSIAAGPLSDGRLQLFAWSNESGGTLWSSWKTNTNPDADWTKWSSFDMGGFIGFDPQSVVRQGNGSLQLFFLASEPLPVDVTGGPSVATSWKVVADDPGSAWATWQIFYNAKYGPPGSGTTGITYVASAPLPNGSLQVFMMEVPGQLQTAWQQSAGGPWVNVRPFTPQPPETLSHLTAAPLSDDRIQLWGVGTQDIWSTWKDGTAENAGWHEWSKFQSVGVNFNSPVALAAGRLPDGRLQLWTSAAESDSGAWRVLTCWKTSGTDSNSSWTP